MKKFGIIRLNSSPYFAPDFLQNEKITLEAIEGLSYISINEADQFSNLILITNTHSQINLLSAEILQKTKLIIHANSGYDNLIHDFSLIEHIPILIGHEIRSRAVAEYVMGTIFESMLPIPSSHTWDQKRSWPRKLLFDYRFALFGFGHVGKQVHHFLSAFNCPMTIIDPFVDGCLKSWKEIDVKNYDFIISTMSLNKQNIHYFNSSFFSQLSSSVVFINSARGKLVEENSLKSFLKTQPKAKAYLDVFENEPFEEDWSHISNSFKTSHIAGVYERIDQKTIEFETKVVKDFFQMNEQELKNKYLTQLLQLKFKQGFFI